MEGSRTAPWRCKLSSQSESKTSSTHSKLSDHFHSASVVSVARTLIRLAEDSDMIETCRLTPWRGKLPRDTRGRVGHCRSSLSSLDDCKFILDSQATGGMGGWESYRTFLNETIYAPVAMCDSSQNCTMLDG